MRLIDADALIPNISVKAVFGNDVTTMKCGELRTILEMIENAPTIEPQKKRGTWIKENIVLTSYPPQFQWYCSECGTIMHGYSAEILTNFCPSCGADMREE